MSIGFYFPFQRSSGSIGYFETTNSQIEAITQNVKSLLLTNWGERLMRTNFGCNLIEFVFDQQRDETLKLKIADRINNQISKWLPFIKIDELLILFDSDDRSVLPNEVRISINFSLLNNPDQRGNVTQSLSSST